MQWSLLMIFTEPLMTTWQHVLERSVAVMR
jgi:hypothetical protein